VSAKPTTARRAPGDPEAAVERGVKGLRVGFLREAQVEGLDPEVAANLEEARRLFGQRLHPFGQRIALKGESELCTVLCKCFRNSPGDRVVVRHPHDQSAFALHQAATRGSMLISHGRWPTRDE